jgi:MtN3 and saliva related transmembrane protein
MLTSFADSVGYIAACLSTASFIPQAVMTWKRKRAEGVSLGMYVILTLGLVLWLAYGVMMDAWPVIISNLVTLGLTIFIMTMKIVYK